MKIREGFCLSRKWIPTGLKVEGEREYEWVYYLHAPNGKTYPVPSVESGVSIARQFEELLPALIALEDIRGEKGK